MTTLSDFLTTYQPKIDETIQKYSAMESSPYLMDPINYILTNSGKKIRPILVLLTEKICNADLEEALKAAASIELFHIFSLVHDDIMDEDEFRRGQPTIHKKWDESVAILAGDGLLALSNMIINDVNTENYKPLMQTYSKTFFDVCAGQAYDKEFEYKTDVTIDDYLNMIGLKTSALLGASCRIGSILGSNQEAEWQSFYEFGYHLGLAFQIQDDILDLYADQDVLGKDVASDVYNDKKSVLTLYAKTMNVDYAHLTTEKSEPNITELKRIFKDDGILEKSMNLKDEYSNLAFNFISSLSDSNEKKLLLELIEKLNNRIA